MAALPIFVLAFLTPVAVWAHVGHLGEFTGHDHLVAGVAIGIAIALGLREALKGKQASDEEAEEVIEDAEAPA